MPESPLDQSIANPVIPNEAFAAAAKAAMSSARSPLEAANERAGQQASQTNQQANYNQPAVQHLDQPQLDDNALAKARQADNQRQQQAVDPEKKTAQQQATEVEVDPSVANEPWKQHNKRPKNQRATADDWNAIKAKHETEVAAIRKELEAARNGSTADITKHPEFAKLKSQHDEYLDALKQVAVERDPEFKAKFDTRRNAVINQAKFAAGGAFDKIEKLLTLPPSDLRDNAIEAAIADFNPSTQARLRGQLQVLSQIDTEREAELASRKALYETNQNQLATQQVQQRQQREAQLNSAFDKQIRAWSDPEEGHPLLQHREGDEKWNRQVEKRIALARSIFSGETDPTVLVQAALKASSHDAALQMAYEATQEVERLTAQLARMNGIQTGDSSFAASIMQNGRNDATQMVANQFDPRYVNHFSSNLEEARKADYAAGGGGGQ